MANKNRADNKTGYQAVTDRTPPYDAEPLIQKADQQTTIGDDLMDSTIMRIPTIGAINNPSAAFNVDFDFDGGRDRYDIDTTGSADAAFTITLAGLNDNETGILNITKKSNDTFSFGNGLITPFNNTEGQDGQTSIVLFVKVVGSTYIVQIGYNYIVDTPNIKDEAITSSKILDGTILDSDLNSDIQIVRTDSYSGGNVRLKVVEIGSWNMVSTSFKAVSHGLALSSIVGATAYIRNDDYSRVYNLNGNPSSYERLAGSIDSFSSSSISLGRNGGDFFDDTDFDNSSINRGWVLVYYID